MTIESNGYVATAQDIARLVASRIESDGVVRQAQTTYLRALIATAQHQLGIVPRAIRTATKKEADDATIQAHAAALAAVQATFYEAVQGAAKQATYDADDSRSRDAIVASRIVFARSAYSTVRSWIMRGKHSLASINASKATKRALFEATPKRVSTQAGSVKKSRLMKQAQNMLDTIVEAGKQNREDAILALQDVLNLLTHGFDDLGMPAVSIRDAVEHTATGVIQEATRRLRRKAA